MVLFSRCFGKLAAENFDRICQIAMYYQELKMMMDGGEIGSIFPKGSV